MYCYCTYSCNSQSHVLIKVQHPPEAMLIVEYIYPPRKAITVVVVVVVTVVIDVDGSNSSPLGKW